MIDVLAGLGLRSGRARVFPGSAKAVLANRWLNCSGDRPAFLDAHARRRRGQKVESERFEPRLPLVERAFCDGSAALAILPARYEGSAPNPAPGRGPTCGPERIRFWISTSTTP